MFANSMPGCCCPCGVCEACSQFIVGCPTQGFDVTITGVGYYTAAEHGFDCSDCATRNSGTFHLRPIFPCQWNFVSNFCYYVGTEPQVSIAFNLYIERIVDGIVRFTFVITEKRIHFPFVVTETEYKASQTNCIGEFTLPQTFIDNGGQFCKWPSSVLIRSS